MKRKIIIITLITLIFLTGCCMTHDYSEATCTTPATCNKCGETKGEFLPHTYVYGANKNTIICSECGTMLELLCEWADHEYTKMEAIADGDFYYNPNDLKKADISYDGTLETCGSYKKGYIFAITYVTQYNGKQYWAIEKKDGSLWMALSDDFVVLEEIDDTTNNEHKTDEKQSQSASTKLNKNTTGLYIYKDKDGKLHCAQSLHEAIIKAVDNAGLSSDRFSGAIVRRYYDATIDKNNSKIHYDIIDSLVAELAEERANVSKDSGNSNESDKVDKQQVANSDSPYISDRCGYKVGQVYTFDAYNITYLGEDRWYDDWNRVYYTAVDQGNGTFNLYTDEYFSRVYAKEGEVPVSERLGYKVGDYITYQSLGFTFNRIYIGNDIWYDDNMPDIKLRAYINGNGEIDFERAD